MTKKAQTSVGFLLAMAGLGGLLYGIDFGTIAAAMPYIRALGMFLDGELSVVVGAVLFGGALRLPASPAWRAKGGPATADGGLRRWSSSPTRRRC